MILALHILAVLCVWLAGIAWIWKGALTAAITFDHWFWRTRGSGRFGDERLMYSQAHGWTLEQEGRAPQVLAILPSTVVTPWLIILHGRVGNRRREWIIARDSVDEESFRCLRVYLRVLPFAERQASDAPSRDW